MTEYSASLAKQGEDVPVHALSLYNRCQLELSGVEDVCSFDETCAVLKIDGAVLTVDGEDLRVVRLEVEKGELQLEGKVFGLFYADGGAARGLLSGTKRRNRKSR